MMMLARIFINLGRTNRNKVVVLAQAAGLFFTSVYLNFVSRLPVCTLVELCKNGKNNNFHNKTFSCSVI